MQRDRLRSNLFLTKGHSGIKKHNFEILWEKNGTWRWYIQCCCRLSHNWLCFYHKGFSKSKCDLDKMCCSHCIWRKQYFFPPRLQRHPHCTPYSKPIFLPFMTKLNKGIKNDDYWYYFLYFIDKLYLTLLYTSRWSRFELTISVGISTECIDSCESN